MFIDNRGGTLFELLEENDDFLLICINFAASNSRICCASLTRLKAVTRISFFWLEDKPDDLRSATELKALETNLCAFDWPLEVPMSKLETWLAGVEGEDDEEIEGDFCDIIMLAYLAAAKRENFFTVSISKLAGDDDEDEPSFSVPSASNLLRFKLFNMNFLDMLPSLLLLLLSKLLSFKTPLSTTAFSICCHLPGIGTGKGIKFFLVDRFLIMRPLTNCLITFFSFSFFASTKQSGAKRQAISDRAAKLSRICLKLCGLIVNE